MLPTTAARRPSPTSRVGLPSLLLAWPGMDPGPRVSQNSEPLQVALFARHPIEQRDLLALGRNELKNAFGGRGWRQPKLPVPQDFSLHAADCYRYHLRPPAVLGPHPRVQLRPWDSQLANEIAVYVPQLEDFDPQLSMNRLPPPATQPAPEVEWFTLIPKACF